MALPTGSMGLSLLMCRHPGPAPRLPALCIRHGATIDNRYWAVAATAACRRQQQNPLSCTTTKDLQLLHLPAARAQQGRLFCSHKNYIITPGKMDPEHDSSTATPSFGKARNKLQVAVAEKNPEKMLESLRLLKFFADSKDYYGDRYNAEDLLSAALSPLSLVGKHGGLDLDGDLVKESLEVAHLLLQNAPDKVRIRLWSEISVEKKVKTILERISDRGSGGIEGDELSKLAKEILTYLLPLTTLN